VTESLASNDPGEQKRRSTRITQAVPITVTGVDALGQPFKERTTTIGVNCHGCKYQSKHYVPKNSLVTLEIPRTQAGNSPRSIQGRVIWVQRPRTVRELFQIGIEFDVAGNVWGIAFPPEDWFPYPDDVSSEVVADSSERVETATSYGTQEPPAPAASSKTPEAAPTASFEVPSSPEGATPAAPPAPPSAPPEGKIHVVPSSPAPSAAATPGPQEAQLASARQMAKMVAEAKDTLDKTIRRGAQTAINEEMTVVRQQLDAQLHEAVERAIKVSMERVSESAAKKVVQQAADRTAAIVEEARKATQESTAASTAQLDAKVREAVEAAVGGAAQEAAQRAAEQAAAANLKQSVEEVVERVIAEREASSPSLQILSSPEAAQEQLDHWKKSLEDAATSTRSAALEQTQTDVAAANQRLLQNFEAALGGASADLSQKLSEAAQAAFAKAEEEFAAKSGELRGALDQTLASAHTTIESAANDAQNMVRAVTEDAQKAARSLASELEQERGRAEAARAELSRATEASTESVSAAAQAALASIAAELEEERLRAEQAKAGLHEAAHNALAQAEEEFAAKSLGLRAALDQALAGAHGSVQAITAGLEQERMRAEAAQAELQQASQQAIEQTRANLDQLLASQQDEIARRADQVISERTQLVEPMLRNSAEKVLEHFSNEMEREISPKIADAQRAASELANAAQQASLVRESVSKQAQEASEQAVLEAVARLRQETAKVPAEAEEAARLVLAKTQQDLDQKASETQHETYEALLKASDWYQKKAHTSMQSALEKAVEQSTSSLRDRAAEISSLAASELDHQRRAYVNHAQAQIEETAKDVIDRERGKLVENADMASAGFANRVNQLTADSFKKFEESSRAAIEKARSDMEFVREASFVEYEKKMEERITLGIDQARTQLQSQLVPLMEEWDAARESEKRLWMENVKKQTDESIDHYKTRLENASNSWLLASAATLGQNSQAMLDTLAKAAEKRIRETCADVLAGMGDQLKDRLIGISSRFAPDEDDDHPGATPPAPPKKNPNTPR
jgi:hypothetical protein